MEGFCGIPFLPLCLLPFPPMQAPKKKKKQLTLPNVQLCPPQEMHDETDGQREKEREMGAASNEKLTFRI